VREITVARLLKQHRIRRLDAIQVLATLRQPAMTVADRNRRGGYRSYQNPQSTPRIGQPADRRGQSTARPLEPTVWRRRGTASRGRKLSSATSPSSDPIPGSAGW
jgi:hypothetical protein